MDTAKAVNILMGNPSPIHKYMGMMRGQMKPGVTLILIHTTSGTGSEVTTMAVLTDTTDNNKKKGPAGPTVRATLAIVDPVLTMGMPPSVTAETGMDAFAHAAEAITSGQANPMSDVVGERAIYNVCKYLPRAVKDGSDLEARTQVMIWATQSATPWGRCFTFLMAMLVL